MNIKQVRNNIAALKLFTFLDSLYPLSILLIVWYYQITGSYTLAAAMFGISTIASGLFEIPSGIISDKLGRVRNIRISAFLWFISYVIAALAGTAGSLGTMLLIITAIISGLAGALNSGTKEALIYETLADVRKQSKFDIAFSRIMMFEQIGAMCGAGIAATVMFFADLQILAWITAIVGALFFTSSFLLREPKTAPKVTATGIRHFLTAAREIWRDKKLRALVGIKMLDGSGTYSIEGAYFATLIPAPIVPFARLFRQFTGAIGFYIAPFVRRFGFLRILLLSEIGSIIFRIVGVGINTIITPFVNSATNLFYGLNTTASNSLMQESFTDEQRATMKNIQSLLASISEGLLLLMFGVIADLCSLRAAIVASIIQSIIIAILYWRMFKRYKN
jgi:MFS family permease